MDTVVRGHCGNFVESATVRLSHLGKWMNECGHLRALHSQHF